MKKLKYAEILKTINTFFETYGMSNFDNLCIGISDNPIYSLFTLHNVHMESDIWIYCMAEDSKTATDVYKYYLSKGLIALNLKEGFGQVYIYFFDRNLECLKY